jgi:hypothetical protein
VRHAPVAVRAALAAGLLILPAACSETDDAPPVATVSFSTSKSRVALNSPVDFTYRFDVAPDAKIPEGYRVFVHIKDDQGDRIWDDDHDPPVPPSQWVPGQTVQYTRTRFVPVFPYIGDVTVEAGLHNNNDRLPLQGPDPADRQSVSRSYKVGALEVLPMSENVFVINTSGWHPAEFAPETPTVEWEWTQKVAEISFRNPRRDVTFYLEYDARPDVFPKGPQQVTISSGGQPVYTFVADQPVHYLHRIPITAAQLGNEDMAGLRIEVDKVFVPARLPSGGRDERELGIRVYHKFIEVR